MTFVCKESQKLTEQSLTWKWHWDFAFWQLFSLSLFCSVIECTWLSEQTRSNIISLDCKWHQTSRISTLSPWKWLKGVTLSTEDNEMAIQSEEIPLLHQWVCWFSLYYSYICHHRFMCCFFFPHIIVAILTRCLWPSVTVFYNRTI